MKTLVIGLFPVLSMFAVPGSAVQSQDTAIVPLGATDELTLGSLLDVASEVLNVDHFLVDTLTLEEGLEIHGSPQVPRGRFLGWFERVLRQHDFVYMTIGQAPEQIHVVRKIQPQGGRGAGMLKIMAPWIAPDLVREMGNRDTLVSTWFTTRNIPARDLQNTMQGYLTDAFTEHVRQIEGTSTLVITGFASSVSSMLQMMERIDQIGTGPGPDQASLARRVEALEAQVSALQKRVGR